MPPLPFPFALNIGTDVVHLPRILRLLRHRGARSQENYLDKFTRRILCPQEQQDFHARFSSAGDGPPLPPVVTSDMARWLAGRFAAKEAARKAAPGGAASIGWKDVLIRAAPSTAAGSGRPEVVFLGAESRIGKLSISHDGDYVVATVLAAGDN
ncbi:uncharacterized protein TRUGW13939_01934 [Talaromyces rugulosus]|uniref:4'-phosphopantetheinyl transferase domain-containing protein n=1 Tax=Talaromyces rugulosus TaxID=121627 RepID=A0A7H8QN01_TALRU|nr:uncharacterized protein TRUGW13939_01934 [Talaromyces rugulosus]QKX54845.1 hypothetical protein TRUGW13939_01934 [Talaromyces rugulosus]